MNLILENNIPGLEAWKYTRRLDIWIGFITLAGKLYANEIFLIFMNEAFWYPKELE